jgi:hypothetical protein
MTAPAPIALRPLSIDETDAVCGGFAALGMAIATSIALQTVKDQNDRPRPTSSRTAYAVLNFIKS